MAEMHEEAKAVKPSTLKPKAGLELDDDDNVADFLEVQHYHTAAPLCPVSSCIFCLGVSSYLCKSSPCPSTACLSVQIYVVWWSNVSLMRYGVACQPAQLVLAVLLNNVLAPSLVLQATIASAHSAEDADWIARVRKVAKHT